MPLLGACVPPPVADAFCGPAARIESAGPASGCVFRSCGEGQWLDVGSGACVPRASLPHGGSIECREPAVAVVETGGVACVGPDAACPRGTTPGGTEGNGRRVRTCARPPPCPPGSLAEGSACRPVVTLGGLAGNRVDVGAWAALALGVHGGPGSPALCQPLAQHPSAFGLGSGDREASASADAGAAAAAASQIVRVAVAIMVPDQDVSRLHAEVRATAAGGAGGAGDHPLSAVADALVSGAVGTALEALRGLGGEASAASVELEVSCAIGEGSRPNAFPALGERKTLLP